MSVLQGCLPSLSIVLPVRRASATIAATLSSLLPQCRAFGAEIIAVVSALDPASEQLRSITDPNLIVHVVKGRQGVPQLRREGILASRASWIAITEDHCLFPKSWVKVLLSHFDGERTTVYGGPVSNGNDGLLGWALYFNRYSGFMPPALQGRTGRLPGNNACYPREALLDRQALWSEGFWEAELNDALLRDGFSFWLSPELEVSQNQRRGFFEYAALRYSHARVYGARRSAPLSFVKRAFGLAASPLVPLLLYARAARAVARQRFHVSRFVLAAPLLMVYYTAWGLGEAAGYILGGSSCPETD